MSEGNGLFFSGDSHEWPIILSSDRQADSIKLDLLVPAETRWFKGHFDNQPIFPGVAQVFWAESFARGEFDIPEGGYQIKSLKFINMLLPDTKVTLSIESFPQKASWKFKYHAGEIIFSSGTITADPRVGSD